VVATARVKAARRLAARLSQNSGTDVAVCYRRNSGHYCVRWSGTPDVEEMRAYAQQHAGEVEPLGLMLTALTWERR
jgi:hypothetical protein